MFKNLPLRWAIIICFNPVIWFLKISLIFLIKHLQLKPKSKNFKSFKKKKLFPRSQYNQKWKRRPHETSKN